MTPELASRVARLEADMAQVRADMSGIAKEVENLGILVRNLAPLNERTAALAETIRGIEADVQRVEGKFDKRWDRLEESQENARKDSRSLRNLLIGVGVAAMLSPLAAFLFAAAVAKP